MQVQTVAVVFSGQVFRICMNRTVYLSKGLPSRPPEPDRIAFYVDGFFYT